MTNDRSSTTDCARTPTPDFSLIVGGPLYQIMLRARVSDDAAQLVQRRIAWSIALTWLPLLILSALQGNAWGTHTSLPFLRDVEVHARLLLALPLLLAAELIVHRRMLHLLRQFAERNLIPEATRPRFDAAFASAMRLRNSVPAEILLIGAVYAVGVLIVWRHYAALDITSWYIAKSVDGSNLSWAGMWYGLVSLPIFQFLQCRWYFRLFIWIRLLWQVSRIELNLMPTHPDRTGGLGFLMNTAYAFVPVLAAHGVMLSGFIANRIFHTGATLPDFKLEIVFYVGILMCAVLGPLLVFCGQLAKAKRTGQLEYGTLAQRYVSEFDAKWLRGGAKDGEPLIGTADIQSLADLSNSFEVIRSMRLTPLSKDSIMQLAAAILIPVAPLLLTMMPLEEIMKRLVGILF